MVYVLNVLNISFEYNNMLCILFNKLKSERICIHLAGQLSLLSIFSFGNCLDVFINMYSKVIVISIEY